MKLSKHKKKKQLEENLATVTSTSTDFTKKNKMLFYQTISSNFSQERNKNNSNYKNKIIKNKDFKSMEKPKEIKNFKTEENQPIRRKRRRSIVSLHNTPRKEQKINKQIPLAINSLLPTNINSYQHLIRGTNFGIYNNLNWTLRLRDYSHKGLNNAKVIDYKDYYYREHVETNKIKQEKIKLTENFNPPSYYEEDFKKYKKRMQKENRPLIEQMNPNFYKIRHLLFGNNKGKVNYSQFNFETTLRNLKSNKINENKKWEVLPMVKSNKYMTTFLAPITLKGIQNLKNIEKYLSKKYEYNIKDDIFGNDKIKKKIIYCNKNITISGIGETLGDEKYNNNFGEKNVLANKKILEVESNPICKFEFSLRKYGAYNDKKYLTQANFRPKKKI